MRRGMRACVYVCARVCLCVHVCMCLGVGQVNSTANRNVFQDARLDVMCARLDDDRTYVVHCHYFSFRFHFVGFVVFTAPSYLHPDIHSSPAIVIASILARCRALGSHF